MTDLKADREMLEEMQALFEQECSKPPAQRDLALIAQLADAIYEMTAAGTLETQREQALEQLTAIRERKAAQKQKRRWLKPLVSACAVVAAVFCLNAWTLHTWGLKPNEALYQLTQGGIFLTPSDLEKNIELETSPDDPYGIRKICEDMGFSPRTPSYIPEHMILENVEQRGEGMKGVVLWYRNRKQYFTINYTYFEDDEAFQNSTFGIPSDEYNIHTETIGGTQVLISWEDQVFRAIFSENHIVYQISSKKMEYDTAYRVLLSFFSAEIAAGRTNP